MRELKFRAWDTGAKRWTSGVMPVLTGLSLKLKPAHSGIIIEQYTGLKDKNGKEIYEGDIVQESNGKTVVEFSTEGIGSCGCCVDKFWGSGFIVTINDSPEDCEVIGNIHENTELLEKE